MKKITLSVMAVMMLLTPKSICAQDVRPAKNNYVLEIPGCNSVKEINNGNSTTYVPICSTAPKTDNMVTVTMKCKMNDDVEPYIGVVYNKDFKEQFYLYSSSPSSDMQLPEGTYDMFMSFYGTTNYYVFKENVTVKDGDVIEFDQAEAVNDVTYKFYDENNNELFMDVYDGSLQVEDGTADDMSKLTALIHKDYGLVSLITNRGFPQQGMLMEFFVNDLSSSYTIANATRIVANDKTYIYKKVVKDVKPGQTEVLEGDNLMECVTKFDVMNHVENVPVQGYRFSIISNGIAVATEKDFVAEMESEDNTVTTMLYCPEDEDINVMYTPMLANYSAEVNDGYTTYMEYYGASGCQMMGDKNGIRYVNSGTDYDNNGFNAIDAYSHVMMYPGIKDLSFANKDGKMTYGNVCPTTSLRTIRYKIDDYVVGWDNHFFNGRYGEQYGAEAFKAKVERNETQGPSSLVITNDLVTVDGMPGKNVTEINYDLSKDDFTAPTLQTLTFKNDKGIITDRLEKTEGSTIILTGGDFNYNFNEETYSGFFTCGEADVKLYYSESGQENWKELAVNEIAEKKSMPYFGNYYEAATDDIKSEKENHWFDLKICFKDKEGNSQTQTVCPAFMIKNSEDTGIDEVNAANESLTMMAGKVCISVNAEITITDVCGTVIRSTYGKKISTDNLIPGAYIVTARTDKGAVITKKLIVK